MIYNYSEIKKVHIEMTSKCNAACSLCARTIGDDVNPNLPMSELTLDNIKSIFQDIDFVKQLDSIHFCGNFGDPIIAKDFLKTFVYLKTINPNLKTFTNTNGSIRNNKWWKLFASFTSDNDLVVFSIDGLEDTNHIYRKNTNWEKIITNAKSFIDQGGNAEWEFIAFQHNEHQIEEATNLSKNLGFKNFRIKKSSRFNRNSPIQPPTNSKYKNESFDKFANSNEFILENKVKFMPNEFSKFHDYVNSANIVCKVQKEKSIYISSEGYLHPCCWIGLQMYSKFYDVKGSQVWLNIDNIGLENLNCINYSIKQIIEGSYFQKIKEGWSKTVDTGKLLICAYTCGEKYDFFSDQYINYKTGI